MSSKDRPELCALGLPMTKALAGWHPCSCGGHRYYSCQVAEHVHSYTDEFVYLPPIKPSCRGIYMQTAAAR